MTYGCEQCTSCSLRILVLGKRAGLGTVNGVKSREFGHKRNGTKGTIGHSEVLALPWLCIADERVWKGERGTWDSCHLA